MAYAHVMSLGLSCLAHLLKCITSYACFKYVIFSKSLYDILVNDKITMCLCDINLGFV